MLAIVTSFYFNVGYIDTATFVGWVEERNPTLIIILNVWCWVALRLTQPTG